MRAFLFLAGKMGEIDTKMVLSHDLKTRGRFNMMERNHHIDTILSANLEPRAMLFSIAYLGYKFDETEAYEIL